MMMLASAIDWEKAKGAVWRVHAKRHTAPLALFQSIPEASIVV